MSDDMSARVAATATVTRIPLEPGEAARVASATAPTAARFAAAGIAVPFETEPMSFAVVQRQEIER